MGVIYSTRVKHEKFIKKVLRKFRIKVIGIWHKNVHWTHLYLTRKSPGGVAVNMIMNAWFP